MSRIFSQRSVVIATCSALLAAPLWAVPALAATNVGDENSLRAAITAGQDVTLTGNITLTAPIEVPANYAGTINGGGFTVTGAMGDANDAAKSDQYGMFIVQGTTSVTNVTVDGANTWRPFWVKENATLNLNADTTVTKGMTNRPQGDGGGVMVTTGATLNINGATISDSAGSDLPTDGSGQGGAVATRHNATVTGTNCTFTNNHTNSSDATNGGAIFMAANSRLTLDQCTFTGNSTRRIVDRGNQGGAIYADSGTVTTITNSTFNIARHFNTGGAIRALGGVLIVRDSQFNIGALGDAYGISGGAIAVGSTKTVIEGSTFTATDPSTKVTHAGGFIDVVGAEPTTALEGYPHGFTLRNSTLTGAGSWWNGPSIATYGGAIAFEGGPNVNTTYTALIDGTTIKNVTTDENGGAITIGTRKGEAGGATTVTLRNSTIDNTRTRFAWKNTYAGGVYVGPGHTLNVEGGSTIKNSFSVLGGGIYNDGTVTISGDSSLLSNTAYQVGGGIYNDGVLTVDAATMTNNRNAEGRGYPNKDPKELPGGNIYAHKDVTITPNATFDDNDVRVLDTASNILLTGALTKKINVSISEKPLDAPSGLWDETDRRYIGYTVARGTNGYTPVASDAQFLHYATASGDNAAAFDDHTSIGTWDYVLNPDAGTVALGQRAKMTYHSNEGTFDQAQAATAINGGGKAETREQLYYVYSSAPKAYTVDPQNNSVTALLPTAANPVRGDAQFDAWYTTAGPHAGPKNTVAAETQFDFTQFFGAANAKQDGKIVDILNTNALTAYAGWNGNVEVTYEYVSAHANESAAPLLPQTLKDKAAQFDKTGDNAPAIGSNVAAVNPSPATEEINGYKWTFTKWTENGGDIASTAVNNIADSHHFVGVWSVQLTKTHEFISGTANKPLPSEVTDLTPGQGDWQAYGSTITPTNTFAKEVKVSDGTWKFQSWDKNEVPNATANQHFIGTWVFEGLPTIPVTFTVENCLWADGMTTDKVENITVTRKGDGVAGPLGAVIPTGMTPAEGYEGGAWVAPAPSATTEITAPTTFTYSCSKVLHATHEFTSATAGKDLPQAILDGKPADFDFSVNDDVAPGAFTQGLGRTLDVTDGTWTFQSWDKDSVAQATDNQHFIGTWVFTALPPIPVTFTVENCLWEDAATTDKVENITVTRSGDTISGTLGSQIPTGMTPAVGYEGGAWTTPVPTADTVITEPTTFTYACTRIMLKADHEFVSGTPGKELPTTIIEGTPTELTFAYGDDVTVGAFTQGLGRTLDVTDGTWTFQSWDKDSVAQATDNQHFIGTWVFTANPPAPQVVPPAPTVKAPSVLAKTGSGAASAALWAGAMLTLGAAALIARRRRS